MVRRGCHDRIPIRQFHILTKLVADHCYLLLLVAAYFAFAKANPNFYRALFDVLFEESTATPELKKARDRLSVPMKAHAELMREENLEVDLQSFATQMWAALHGAILLDDVGLYGADVLGLHEAIIDALIERYRAPADAVKRLRPKGIKK